MSDKAEFVATGDALYRVTGDLVFDSVPAVWTQSRSRLGSEPEPRIDLGAVSRVDSAALALVLEWLKWGARNGRRVKLLNMPEKLRALARISEVSHLIEDSSGTA